jgi:long-chain acyl-CoA synthetase
MRDTVITRFQSKADAHGDAPLWYDFQEGAWRPTSWTQARVIVEEIAAGLMAIDVAKGDRVGFLGVNSPDWVATDYGILHAGAVGVPLYNTLAPDQLSYVLGHADATVLVVDSPEQLDKALASDISGVAKIVAHHLGDADRGRVIGTAALRKMGREFVARNTGALRQRMESVARDDLFSIIYTSGTTGPPKGTMLTHDNILWTAGAAFARLGMSETETMISYLPLSHVFERLTTTITPLTGSDKVEFYFVPEPTMLPDALKHVRPTLFIGVPRVWEKFEARIRAGVGEESPLRQKLINFAMEGAVAAIAARDGAGSAGVKQRLGAVLASKVVGKKVLGELGLDRCRIAISGAAPLAPDVQRFFQGLGLPLHQGWGLTESTAAGTVQAPGQLHVGSVGPALDGTEIELADDGEILMKGPNVFRGYYNEPENTAEMLKDGWLHTGDIGEILADGSLKIVDRKKDIIITAGGKNVAPQEIESRIKADGLVAEAIVIGDHRPYLAALISLDLDEAKTWLHQAGDEVTADADVYRHPKVLRRIEETIDGVNARFSKAESVRRWQVVEGGFPADAITPTLKLKRRVINDKLGAEIDSLYS